MDYLFGNNKGLVGEAIGEPIPYGFADDGFGGVPHFPKSLLPHTSTNKMLIQTVLGGDGGVGYEFEVNYFYPITDNIAIAPSFYVILNPNNFDSNAPIYVSNFRLQFNF